MFFLKLSWFFDDPTDVGNLISVSSAFSKSSLNIWKFTVHVLLKPGLENFEKYFASMWDECNCVVVPEPQVTSKTSEVPTVYPEMFRDSTFKCVWQMFMWWWKKGQFHCSQNLDRVELSLERMIFYSLNCWLRQSSWEKKKKNWNIF